MNEFIEIISNVGFPIACVVALGWYAKDTTNKIIELTTKVTDALVSSTKAIDEMKNVIEKIIKED